MLLRPVQLAAQPHWRAQPARRPAPVPCHPPTACPAVFPPARQVAILCNHQRSVPKGHQGQMEKLQEKLAAIQEEIDVS